MFAEYAEGKVANGSSGVSDTGLTMRAFLPVSSDGNKSLIHTYRGPATVIDARVVCVRPNITNLGVHIPESSDNLSYQPLPVLHGNLSIPLDLLHAAASSRVSIGPYADFNCTFPTGLEGVKYQKTDWNLTLCQLDRVAGMLRTDFFTAEDPPPEKLWSHLPHQTYLLTNLRATSTSKLSGILAETSPFLDACLMNLHQNWCMGKETTGQRFTGKRARAL